MRIAIAPEVDGATAGELDTVAHAARTHAREPPRARRGSSKNSTSGTRTISSAIPPSSAPFSTDSSTTHTPLHPKENPCENETPLDNLRTSQLQLPTIIEAPASLGSNSPGTSGRDQPAPVGTFLQNKREESSEYANILAARWNGLSAAWTGCMKAGAKCEFTTAWTAECRRSPACTQSASANTGLWCIRAKSQRDNWRCRRRDYYFKSVRRACEQEALKAASVHAGDHV